MASSCCGALRRLRWARRANRNIEDYRPRRLPTEGLAAAGEARRHDPVGHATQRRLPLRITALGATYGS